jgi:hypothetical protein
MPEHNILRPENPLNRHSFRRKGSSKPLFLNIYYPARLLGASFALAPSGVFAIIALAVIALRFVAGRSQGWF